MTVGGNSKLLRSLLSLGRILFVYSAALIVCRPAFASPLSDLASSMQAGEWRELITNNINPVLLQNGSSGNALGYTNDIVFDPGSQKFFYIGSDHNGIGWSV